MSQDAKCISYVYPKGGIGHPLKDFSSKAGYEKLTDALLDNLNTLVLRLNACRKLEEGMGKNDGS